MCASSFSDILFRIYFLKYLDSAHDFHPPWQTVWGNTIISSSSSSSSFILKKIVFRVQLLLGLLLLLLLWTLFHGTLMIMTVARHLYSIALSHLPHIRTIVFLPTASHFLPGLPGHNTKKYGIFRIANQILSHMWKIFLPLKKRKVFWAFQEEIGYRVRMVMIFLKESGSIESFCSFIFLTTCE